MIRRRKKVLLEKYLINHCAPTLASIKTANLFCCTVKSETELKNQLKELNIQFYKKGLFLMVLRRRGNKALIYVYRRSYLQMDLQKDGVAQLLSEYGYQNTNVGYALNRLKLRLKENESFPHEIGLFLGYPLGDVIGFIRNEGKNCKCTGCWKVYCNECEAMKQFAQFQKCKEIYTQLWNNGKTVWQLTVAA